MWQVSHEPLVIGRAGACDIFLDDQAVSRRHCEVHLVNGRPEVHDLGSSNCTLVNGEEVETQTLAQGDRIGIGDALFIVVQTNGGEAEADEEGSPPVVEGSLTEEHSLFLSQPSGDTGSFGKPQTIRDLVELFRLCRKLNATESSTALCSRLHEGLSSRLGSCTLFICRRHGPGNDVFSQQGQPLSSAGVDGAVRKMLKRAMEQGRALEHDHRLLSAPMRTGGRTIGSLCVRLESKPAEGTGPALEYLLAVASVSAPLFLTLEQAETALRELDDLRESSGVSMALIGASEAIVKLNELLVKTGRSGLNVLVEGETGTGKEICARMLHAHSDRGTGPFVAINCAALPEELFESELFGHEKGAFTGATSRKTGRLEQAHGGTLFLDEVGDLSPANQARLLRAIETGLFYRVGAEQESQVDVRVVSATNRDITGEVDAGRFRPDLLHRLGAFRLQTPPLREHPEDIPVLARHFLEKFRHRARQPIEGFTKDALTYLSSRRWPGNVRELRAAVERGVALAEGERIRREDFMEGQVPLPGAAPDEVSATLEEIERAHVVKVLDQVEGNMSKAARILGISRATLYKKVEDYGISPKDA